MHLNAEDRQLAHKNDYFGERRARREDSRAYTCKNEAMKWTGWGDMRKPLGKESEQLFINLVNDAVHMIQHK